MNRNISSVYVRGRLVVFHLKPQIEPMTFGFLTKRPPAELINPKLDGVVSARVGLFAHPWIIGDS